MGGEWGGPVRPEGDPSGWGWIADKLRQQDARIAALETRDALQNATISKGGLVVTGGGSVTVHDGGNVAILDDGDLSVDGTAAFGGDTTIGGNLAVTGTLSLPAGIINNDDLANPVSAAVATPATTSGWATSTSMVTKASTSIAVPAGFSKALVVALGGVVFRSDPGPNDFTSRVVIAGQAGASLMNLANAVGATPVSHSDIVSGLSGGSILVEIQVSTLIAEAAATGRYAQIAGFAFFFRD